MAKLLADAIADAAVTGLFQLPVLSTNTQISPRDRAAVRRNLKSVNDSGRPGVYGPTRMGWTGRAPTPGCAGEGCQEMEHPMPRTTTIHAVTALGIDNHIVDEALRGRDTGWHRAQQCRRSPSPPSSRPLLQRRTSHERRCLSACRTSLCPCPVWPWRLSSTRLECSTPRPRCAGQPFRLSDGGRLGEFPCRSSGQWCPSPVLEECCLEGGEDLRTLRRDRAWVETAGFKGGRMYFRKAVLACCEREWRHVEYEFPAEAERVFQAQVDRTSRAFDSAYTQFCDQTVGRPN
jgi:hypothetical protein